MSNVNYQAALRNISRLMVEVREADKLFTLITEFLNKELGVLHASVIVYNEAKDSFVFCDSKGKNKLPINLIKLDKSNPIISWFLNGNDKHLNKEFISLKIIESVIADADKYNIKIIEDLKNIKNTMLMLKSEICIPGLYNGDLIGILLLGNKKDNANFTDEDIDFFHILASDISISLKSAEHYRRLNEKIDELSYSLSEIKRLREKDKSKLFQTILTFSKLVDARDSYTFGHSEEVEKLGMLTAEELNISFTERQKQILSTALILHDIGKIGVADRILHKESKLNNDEWLLMQDHPRIGAAILDRHEDFKEVSKIILHHHENYDGTGYPSRLIAEEIPIESRIIAVVDAYHAMVSDRPYRKGLSVEYAVNEVKKCSGKQFDPSVVDAFLKVVSLISLKENHSV